MALVRPAPGTRRDAATAAVLAIAGVAICVLLGLAIAAGAADCGPWSGIPRACDSPTLLLPVAVFVAALPILILCFAGRPLATLVGIYIVLVPIDDALLVGSGVTVTKIFGILIALAAAGAMLQRGIRTSLPYAALGWLAVVTLMGASILWSIDPEQSTENIVTIVSAFALLAILAAVRFDAAELRTVIGATILSGAVVGLTAIGLSHHDISNLPGQVGRLYLTFGSSTLDPNRFGASLLLPIAMTAGAIAKTKGWLRIALFVPLLLALAAVYLAASRGTLVALAAMGVVAILASRRRVLLGAILTVCGILVFVVPSELSRRLYEGTASNGTGRFDIWRVAIAAFPQHWLLGSGQGTFVSAYDRAFFSAYQPQFIEWGRDPHNLIMSTGVELGTVGLIVLFVALVLQYRSVRLIPPDYAWLRPVYTAAFLGLVVAAMFVDVLATKFAWLLFTEMLLFAGLAADRRPLPS